MGWWILMDINGYIIAIKLIKLMGWWPFRHMGMIQLFTSRTDNTSECHTCAKGEWLAPASSAVRTKRSWSCGVAKNCASAKASISDTQKKWVLPRYVWRNIHEYCKQIIYSIQYKYNYVYVIEIYRTSIILSGRGSKKGYGSFRGDPYL